MLNGHDTSNKETSKQLLILNDSISFIVLAMILITYPW